MNASDQNARKQAVAEAAVAAIIDELRPSAILGIGTGSTANLFIDALAPLSERFAGAVASSEATAQRLRGHGIRVVDLNEVDHLPVYIDGADEADPSLALIKGGGGALTREKIVVACARRFICIVDSSKCVDELGAFPLPIEVLPMARALVERSLRQLGGEPTLREGFVTDSGNLILDVQGLDLANPQAMERRLNDLVGTVCNGLFALRGADLMLVGAEDGVETRRAR